MLSLDPQNPYDSFMVEASAGTGKTYQLTQRFLFLVGAGADPSEILAITFTVKAVGEMHARIITEASELLVNTDYQRRFEKKLKSFYKEFMASKEKPYSFSEPRSAKATARLILTSTQRLKISTIDSIFYEWVMRFPAESSLDAQKKDSFLRSLNLMESYENERINQSAWNTIFVEKEASTVFEKSFKIIDSLLPQKGFLGVQKQIEELDRYRLHIFYLEQKGTKAFLSYQLNLAEKLYEKSVQDILFSLKEDFYEICKKTKKEEAFRNAIGRCDLDFLIKNRLLTKTGLVSKSLIRGNKREALSESITRIEAALTSFLHEKSKHHLNQVGESLFSIFKLWSQKRDLVKKNLMICEFSDLSVGCHHLFSREGNTSVLWLLQKSIHHILIDEFQDTSMVQWEVFSNLLSEIMSAFESSTDDKSHKTSFIVGDRKQSIYGFREADPYVMHLSSEFFNHYGKKVVPLNKSYRTSPLIMDFLSDFFLENIDKNFPLHATAEDEKGVSVVPNVSRVVVCPNFSKEEGDTENPLEKEAGNLASFLEELFKNPEKYPVFDKEKKFFREIRYSDCCILYRNATHVDTFIEALSQKNIPVRREGESSFFESIEIKAVLSLLRFFVDPCDILSLLVFLKSNFFEIPELFLLEALEETKEKDPYERREAFFEIIKEKGFSLDNLQIIRKKSYSILPHKALLLVYKLFPSFLSEEDKDFQRERVVSEKNLMRLFDLFLDIEKKGFLTLQSSLNELDKMSALSLQGSQDTLQESVAFMTIHKSKGLEFPFVGLIEASDSWFKFDRYWIKSGKGLYYSGTYDVMPHEDLFFKLVYKESERLMYEETIRLLYVALTRASQYLFISAHKSATGSGSRFHTQLVDHFKKKNIPEQVGTGYYVLEAGNGQTFLT